MLNRCDKMSTRGEGMIWYIVYCVLVLGSNILAYFMQIDMSMIYLAGILGILYWYLSSDLSKKKKRKKVSFSLAMMWLWPLLLNVVVIFLLYFMSM